MILFCGGYRKSKDDDHTPAPLQPPISRKPQPQPQAGSSSTSHPQITEPQLSIPPNTSSSSGYSNTYSHSISPPKGYTVPNYPLPILAPAQNRGPITTSSSGSGSGLKSKTKTTLGVAGPSSRSPPGLIGDHRPSKRVRDDERHPGGTTQSQSQPQPLRPPHARPAHAHDKANHFASLTTSAFTLPPSSEPHRPLHSPTTNLNTAEHPSIPGIGINTPSPAQAQAQAWTQKALLLGPETEMSSSTMAEGSGGKKRKMSEGWAGLNPNSPPVPMMTEDRAAYSPDRGSRKVGKGGVGVKRARAGSKSGSKTEDHLGSPSRRIRPGEHPGRGLRPNEFTSRGEMSGALDPVEERKERDRRNELMARAAEGRHLERIAFDEEHMECEF